MTGTRYRIDRLLDSRRANENRSRMTASDIVRLHDPIKILPEGLPFIEASDCYTNRRDTYRIDQQIEASHQASSDHPS